MARFAKMLGFSSLRVGAFHALLLLPIASVTAYTQEKVTPKLYEDQANWGILVKGAASKDDPEIKKLVDTKITLVGWIIPNEYDQGELSSFLLTRYPSGCVHVPLPPPENVVHVSMSEKSKKLRNVSLTKKVVVVGKLKYVGRVDSVYELEGESVRDSD